MSGEPDRLGSGRLLLEQDLDEPEAFDLGPSRVAVFTRRAPGKSGVNEDAIALLPFAPGGLVLAVADGAGGMRAGNIAARLALENLRQALADGAKADFPLRESILDGFDRANAAVSNLGEAATTLAVAEVGSDLEARTYHAGDSPILVVGGRGRVKLETVDHSPVGYAVEAGLLDREEAIHEEHRHLISNFVGMPEMRVEMSSPLRLAPMDRLLLASDGLYDNLHQEEIVDIIRRGPVDSAARRLVDACRQRMKDPGDGGPSKEDDLTVVLYRLRAAARTHTSP